MISDGPTKFVWKKAEEGGEANEVEVSFLSLIKKVRNSFYRGGSVRGRGWVIIISKKKGFESLEIEFHQPHAGGNIILGSEWLVAPTHCLFKLYKLYLIKTELFFWTWFDFLFLCRKIVYWGKMANGRTDEKDISMKNH